MALIVTIAVIVIVLLAWACLSIDDGGNDPWL